MPRSSITLHIAGIALLAALTAGCSGMTDAFKNDSGFVRGPFAKFSREDGSSAAVTDRNFQLSPTGSVAAEDLVQPDGRCAAPVAATPQPAAQPVAAQASADRPAGSVAGDLAGAAPAGADPGAAPLLGGIALGMSECETVRRAGLASNVSIGAGDKGERKVVLTYLDGSWPGVYTFSAGRLKDISAAPGQPKSARTKSAKRAATKKQPQRTVRPSAAAPATQIR